MIIAWNIFLKALQYVWQGSKYRQTIEYFRVLNMPCIRNMSHQFLKLSFFLIRLPYFFLGACNFEQAVFFPGISFLRIIFHVITLPNIQIIFPTFNSSAISKIPKFCQISTTGCVIKSSVAHILRSGWKNQ